jgi:hypothetical protein
MVVMKVKHLGPTTVERSAYSLAVAMAYSTALLWVQKWVALKFPWKVVQKAVWMVERSVGWFVA